MVSSPEGVCVHTCPRRRRRPRNGLGRQVVRYDVIHIRATGTEENKNRLIRLLFVTSDFPRAVVDSREQDGSIGVWNSLPQAQN